MTNTIADIEEADVILITGSNTSENHPVLSSFVKRAVTQVVTPGVVVDVDHLDARQNNYLAAIGNTKGSLVQTYLAANTDSSVCQRSPVAIRTASISLLRKSS